MKIKFLAAALGVAFCTAASAAIHLVVPLSLSSLDDSKSSTLTNSQEHLEDYKNDTENREADSDEIAWEIDPTNPAKPDREKPAKP